MEEINQKSYVLPYNPTAENMAKYILEVVCPDLLKDDDVEVFKVVFYENENCFATAEIL